MRSRVTSVKVKGHVGQGQRSTLKVKKLFQSHQTVLQVMFKVKGHGPGSRITWVKVKLVNHGLNVMILADGLMSMSSCIFMAFELFFTPRVNDRCNSFDIVCLCVCICLYVCLLPLSCLNRQIYRPKFCQFKRSRPKVKVTRSKNVWRSYSLM